MADQYSIQDPNRFPAQIVHTGTADTAETVRRTGETSGAAHVHVTGGTVVTSGGGASGTQYDEDTAHSSGDAVTMAGVVQQTSDAALSGNGDRSVLQVDDTGYLKVNVKAGAAGGVSHTDDAAFTPATDDIVPAGAMFDDTSPDSVDEGDAGVVRMSANRNLYNTIRDAAGNERGVNVNASNQLSVDVDAFSVDLPGGTVDLVTTVSNLTNGSVRMTVGTISVLPDLPGGTIDEATVVGGAASGAASSGNPIPMAGTDAGGTVYVPLVDTSGHLQSDVLTLPNVTLNDIGGGTIDLVTTVSTVTGVTNVSNLTKGTVSMIHAGTIDTVTSVTETANLAKGTITSVEALPDIPGGTVDLVSVLAKGTIAVGTTVGAAASGAAASGNPVQLGGTDSGGTIYAPLVDTNGHLQTDVLTLPNVTLNDIGGGTIDEVTSIANIVKGTTSMLHAGTINSVTNVANLAKGTVTVVSNLTNGSVRMTVGTLTQGSLTNIGAIHTAGTVSALPDLPGGTVDLVSNLAGGTVQIDSVPARAVTAYGTLGTTAAEVRGTLVAAAGAGDNYYLAGYEILVHSGTVDCAIEFGTKATVGGADTFGRGKYVPGGGISRDISSPVVSPANGTITYYMGGAGTVFFGVQYYEVA